MRDQLERKGLQPFLPTIRRWSRWADRRKAVDWPLFPGYCFARFEAAESLAVRTCNGVAGIVSFGSEPASIPDVEIDSLRRLVATELQYESVAFVKEGTMVEVVRGPLAGIIGRLVRKGHGARVVLSVELLNRSVSAEVDVADVRPY